MSGVEDYVSSLLAMRKFGRLFREDKECWYHSWGYLDEKHHMFSGDSNDTFEWPVQSKISESKVSLVAHDIFNVFVALGASDQLLLPTDLTLRTAKRLECIGLYGPEVFIECKTRIMSALKRDIFPRFRRSSQFQAMLAFQTLIAKLPSSEETPHRLHFFHASSGITNCPLSNKVPPFFRLPVIESHNTPTASFDHYRRESAAATISSSVSVYSTSKNSSMSTALIAESRRFTFEEILDTLFLYEKFLTFLEKRYCSENLHCYMAICHFESLAATTPLKSKPPSASSATAATYFHQNVGEAYQACCGVYLLFVADGSIWEVNMHSDDRDAILLHIASPHRHMFADVKESLYRTLQFEFLSYKKTPEYHQLGSFLHVHEDEVARTAHGPVTTLQHLLSMCMPSSHDSTGHFNSEAKQASKTVTFVV